ncbi:DUF547 domain-containing protein [Alteromonas sp. 5E99-2]|uniref:DUF547 domain-containing protein n=1 Tax=Alteromonas sp. 5E99-2 TaxID=2817683 RepID=UPI001A994FB1|nr:DUF547 domain-containing protein [Alteromonas sp. 5E99-2]MBO1256048.1 DUF547 domain-containing protein [Alteromonas sp. 5E99-2]
MLSRVVLLVGILLSFQSLGQTPQAQEEAQKEWAYIVANYVDETGSTDFARLAKSDDLARLKQVVEFISKTSPNTHPELFKAPNATMAYYINAYNALAMYGVIDRGIPDGFTSFIKRAKFFKFRDVVIGGEETNLYDFENDVVRPLGEPRAHFALNCMVKDCPRLPQVPFVAETLDEQLKQAAWEFFAKEKHFYRDDKNNAVYVSEILDFYTEDFVESGKTKDLGEYINRYVNTPIPDSYKIKFIDYDWRINAQK